MSSVLHPVNPGSVARGLLSTAVMLLATAVWLTFLPLVLLAAAIDELRRPRRWVIVRSALLIAGQLVVHVAALPVALLAPLWGGSHRAQLWFARSTWNVAAHLLDLRVRAEGFCEAHPGPVVVLARHSSPLDAPLLVMLLGDAGLRLRLVAKHGLRWDPVLDLFGRRQPAAFIDRFQPDAALARIRAAAHDLGRDDGVLIFPEGTRFTPKKRARVLARLKRLGEGRRAERLQHTLPPRPSGTLALLDTRADVLFIAHAGLEGAANPSRLLRGDVIGVEVRVRVWRTAADAVPVEEATRRAWLDRWWRHLDAWIAEPSQLDGESRPDADDGRRGESNLSQTATRPRASRT